MIRKRLKSLVIYAFLAVAVGIIGFYMYKSVMDTNKLFIELDEQEDTVATVVPLDNVNYTIEGKKYRWGIVIPGEELAEDSKNHGVASYLYSVDEMAEKGYKLNVKYIKENDELIVYESDRVRELVKNPWSPSAGIFLYCISGALASVCIYQIIRILLIVRILKKGVLTTGTFISAFHSSFGSAKYYKVKFSYTRNGETFNVITPNCYDSVSVDKFERLVVLDVRVLGKKAVIVEKS